MDYELFPKWEGHNEPSYSIIHSMNTQSAYIRTGRSR